MNFVNIKLSNVEQCINEDNAVVNAKDDYVSHIAWHINNQIIVVEESLRYGITIMFYETVEQYLSTIKDTWVFEGHIDEKIIK